MANWATITYKIEGNNRDLNQLNSIISKSDNLWIGDIPIALGMSQDEIIENYSIRGTVTDYCFYDGDPYLTLYTEEAWGLSDLSKLLKELMPDINIYWYLEEPGCEVYETNDGDKKYFSFIYVAEYYENDDYVDTYYIDSEDELFEITSELTTGEVTDWRSLEKFNENESTCFVVHEINYIP